MSAIDQRDPPDIREVITKGLTRLKSQLDSHQLHFSDLTYLRLCVPKYGQIQKPLCAKGNPISSNANEAQNGKAEVYCTFGYPKQNWHGWGILPTTAGRKYACYLIVSMHAVVCHRCFPRTVHVCVCVCRNHEHSGSLASPISHSLLLHHLSLSLFLSLPTLLG